MRAFPRRHVLLALGLVGLAGALGCLRQKSEPVPAAQPTVSSPRALSAVGVRTHAGYPLHRAILRNRDERHILSLLSQGLNITQQDPDGLTPLALAIRLNRQSTIRILLAMGAKLDVSVCSWKTTTHRRHTAKLDPQEQDITTEVSSLKAYETSLQQQQRGLTPVLETKDSQITLIGFFDFQAPSSQTLAKVWKELSKRYGGKIRLVFKHSPQPTHVHAYLAAQASMAAHAQGKFWPYHDLLFANQKNLKPADLLRYARKLKLNMTQFKKDMYDWKNKAQIDADFRLGIELHGSSYYAYTAPMYINGQRVHTADYMQLVEQVEKQRTQSNLTSMAAGAVVWSALVSNSKWFGRDPKTSRYGAGSTYRSPYRPSYGSGSSYRYRSSGTTYRTTVRYRR